MKMDGLDTFTKILKTMVSLNNIPDENRSEIHIVTNTVVQRSIHESYWSKTWFSYSADLGISTVRVGKPLATGQFKIDSERKR